MEVKNISDVVCEWSITQMYHHESEVIFMCLGTNVSCTTIVMKNYGKYRRDIHEYNQCILISTFVQITFSLKYFYACSSAYSYSCHLRITQNVVNFWKCIFVPLRVCKTTDARCLKFIIYASATPKCSNILYCISISWSSHPTPE